VLDYEKTPQEQRGTFLREKGLHDATLGRWKAEIIEGMKLKPFAQGKKDPQQKRNAALERELRRKRRRCWCLRTADAIWGEERSEK
jgi:transposase